MRGLIEELEAEPSAGRDSVQCQAALLSVGKHLRQALELPGLAAQVTAHSYGLRSYGLYSYGLCIYDLYSHGMCSYGLYSHGIYCYKLYSYCPAYLWSI